MNVFILLLVFIYSTREARKRFATYNRALFKNIIHLEYNSPRIFPANERVCLNMCCLCFVAQSDIRKLMFYTTS